MSNSAPSQVETSHTNVGTLQAQGVPVHISTIAGSEHGCLLESLCAPSDACDLDNATWMFSNTINMLENGDSGFLMVMKTVGGKNGETFKWTHKSFEVVCFIGKDDKAKVEFFVNIPFNGRHKVVSAQGQLKTGVDLNTPPNVEIVKGNVKVYSRNNSEVCLKISVKSPLADVDKDITLYKNN